MPSIKINYQPEIFDDPEKCGTCDFLFQDGFVVSCDLFPNSATLEIDYETDEPFKCQECKRLWKQANESRPPKTLPEGHRL